MSNELLTVFARLWVLLGYAVIISCCCHYIAYLFKDECKGFKELWKLIHIEESE